MSSEYLGLKLLQFVAELRNLDLLSERLQLLVELPIRYSFAKYFSAESAHSKLMELVLRLRDLKLLQSRSIKLLARRRRRLGVDLAMGRAPVAVALVQTERAVFRWTIGVARGFGVTHLLVARAVAVPAVVVVERRVLARLGGRHRHRGERAKDE